MADDVWGGTVDLYQFGVDGKEPEATAALRKLARETEPAVWRLITQGDPLTTKLMEDPSFIMGFAEGLENKSPV